MARKLASVLMVALMGVPPSITALGLGELDSDSGLNEPLSARIPLLSIRDSDPASIHISLASQAAFERAGMERPFYLSRLKFEVKQADGKHYILVSTEKPFKEPFLDFLLDVRWPQGDLQREYTVLLDPPRYSARNPSGPVRSGHASASRARPQSDASAPSRSSTQVAVAGERGIGGSGASKGTRYGPVQANQTLWSIASEVRPYGGVTVYQTMQAILQSNPAAFIDGNINAIMKGSVLRVPPREEIARIDANEATLQMQEQLTRWERKHSSGGSEAPLAQASAQNAAMGQDKDDTAEATPVLMPPAKGGLHVVAARGDAEAHATALLADQALAPTQQNILRLQQQLVVVKGRNAGLKSVNARLQQQASSLEKQLTDLKRIVNPQLDQSVRLPVTAPTAARASVSSAAPQGAAADLRSETTLASASEMPSPPPHLETAEGGHIGQGEVKNAAVAVVVALSEPSPAVTKTQARPAEPLADVSLHQMRSSAAAADQQANAAAHQQVSPSLKTRLLTYLPQDSKRLVLLVSSLLLVLLLPLLWAVRRHRRRGATGLPYEFSPEAPAPTSEQALATVNLDKIALNLDRANTQPQPATAVDEGTPLEEADAYIAYGRYDQAQELLDRALGEHPDSQELRLKLLEVLAAQGDRNGFEAEAQVLHTQVMHESDPYWQRTIQLARHIAPDHPLFSGAMSPDAGIMAVQSEKSVNTATAAAAESTATPMPQTMEAELDLGPGRLALDLSASLGKADLHSADGREQSTVLEFDLGEIETFMSQQAKENVAPAFSQGAAEEDDWGSLDFSLPEERAVPAEDRKGNGSDNDRAASRSGDFSLQSGELDTEGASTAEPDDSVSLDEVGTKLDLARAYLDMGDATGARSLLSEVVTEGNAAQQGEAQELLQQVG